MSATPSRPTQATACIILSACLLLSALVGCGDDNPAMPQNPGPRYLPSSTPQNTLENMRRAYTTRDTTGYDSLFDDAYIGTSIDQSDPSPTLLTFTKTDEALHISALRRATIRSITLQFPPSIVRTTDAADTLGWATIPLSFVSLAIDNASGDVLSVISPYETMEFKFRPTSPSPGSPTDTTWHIVRWSEVSP